MSSADENRKRRHEADELAAAALRMMRALARRAGEGDELALEVLATVQRDTNAIAGAGVAGFRDSGRSWGDVAGILGTSRQGAQQRYGAATVDAAHGPRCRCGMNQCPRNQGDLTELLEVPC